MEATSVDLVDRAFRLVGEVSELPRASAAQREHFLTSAASLIGAQVGIWVRVRRTRQGYFALDEALDVGFEGEAERAAFQDYFRAQRAHPDPTLAPISRLRQPIFACTRRELVRDREWYGSEHVQRVRRAAGVDDCIVAGHLTLAQSDAVSFHRPWGERPFTEAEGALIAVLFREVLRLVQPPRQLPPQLGRVLDGLARGLSEKEVAAELGLSPHTVHGYVKELHRRFGARSRGELLAKVLAR